MTSFVYRAHVVAQLSDEDTYRDVYPLCASSLEVHLYRQCRDLTDATSPFEKTTALPTRVKDLNDQVAVLSPSSRKLFDAMQRFKITLQLIDQRAARLDINELYDQAMLHLERLSDEFDMYLPRLEDATLYALTAELVPQAAETWWNQYGQLPETVETATLKKLNMVFDEMDDLLDVVTDQVEHPDDYTQFQQGI
jgi:hypothetical protein